VQKEIIIMNKSILSWSIIFIVTSLFLNCASNHIGKGWDNIFNKNYNNAIIEFGSALVKKDLPTIYFGLFQGYLGIGDSANAINYLEIGLDKFPNDKWLNLSAGHWYMKRNINARKALFYYEKASNLGFGSPFDTMYKTMKQLIQEAKDKIKSDSLRNAINQKN
jgi:tetratricopeptide (TPR) repeat protein